MSGVLGLCFALSGAAALGLELLWMRSAGLVLGATAPTAATVLAWYFAGLGLGSALGRRASGRPVLRYALLEVGASLGALWSAGVFDALGGDGAQRALLAGGLPARVGAIAIAVLPATLCLGATLPALGQALAAPGAVGRRGGWLYALNTLGGALGVATMGFGLPALVGVRASYAVVAATSAVAGLVALAVAGRTRTGSGRAAEAPVPWRLRLGGRRRRYASVLASRCCGFASSARCCTTRCTRSRPLCWSWCYPGGRRGAGRAAAPHAPPAALAAGALVMAGVATAVGPWGFLRLTGDLGYVGMRTGLGEYVLRIVALAAATAGPAALASGLVLPALWAAAGDAGGAAFVLGDLAAASTCGRHRRRAPGGVRRAARDRPVVGPRRRRGRVLRPRGSGGARARLAPASRLRRTRRGRAARPAPRASGVAAARRDAAVDRRGGGRRRHGRRYRRRPPAPARQQLPLGRKRCGGDRAAARARAPPAAPRAPTRRLHRHGDGNQRQRRAGARGRRDDRDRAGAGGGGRGESPLRSLERQVARAAGRASRGRRRSSRPRRRARALRRGRWQISSSRGTPAPAISTLARCWTRWRDGSRRAGSTASGCRSTSSRARSSTLLRARSSPSSPR